MNEQVAKWCNELKILPEFAKPLPQATYAAFYFGERNRFSYFLRTIPEMNDLMKPVDEIVQNFLLPAINGETISEKENYINCQFDQEAELFHYLVKRPVMN